MQGLLSRSMMFTLAAGLIALLQPRSPRRRITRAEDNIYNIRREKALV
jgi:hypothetical protein